MSGYGDGRRIEYAVIHQLEEAGYEVTRAASSKGFADVTAIKPGQILFVSVKRTRNDSPAGRAKLLRIAGFFPGVAVPLVAIGPVAALQFRELTGVGPREWRAWAPDFAEVAS
jgi:Holliday junction resolvase